MKTKNPSNITRARRALDEAVIREATVVADRLKRKARTPHIAVCGVYLAEYYRILSILSLLEHAGRRELTEEAAKEIGTIIGKYTKVKESDNTSWLGILKPMVGQKRK